MKRFTKHTPVQIVTKLERADQLKAEGKTMAEICRQIGISEATLFRWRKQYGSMNRCEAKELKQLREEVQQLKVLLGQAELDKAALRELAEGNF